MATNKNTRSVFPGIHRWLWKNNTSIRELSARMNVNVMTLHQWLHGNREIRKSAIDKLLRVTGMTYEEAFGDPRGGLNE